MSFASEQVPIIAFDGNHRIGKGTQIGIVGDALKKEGYRPHILRGDGSRPGLGLEENDPHSEYWAEFKEYATRQENLFDAWREGARYLVGEAVVKRQLLGQHDIVLFDRSVLSRTQMTLKEGIEPTFWNMYMNRGVEGVSDDDIRGLNPDLLVYLAADSSIMSERLDPSDPKYEFRRANIVSSNEYFNAAYDVCADGEIPSTRINGAAEVRDVARDIRRVIINSQELREKKVNFND